MSEILKGPIDILVIMPGCDPCKHCGGKAAVHLDVGRTGFGCGGTHIHALDCSSLSCEHGVVWREDCDVCEAARKCPHGYYLDAEDEYCEVCDVDGAARKCPHGYYLDVDDGYCEVCNAD